MYKRTTIHVAWFVEYLTALNLLNYWWEQGVTQTVRPAPEALAMLVGGRVAEMAVVA